MTIELTYNKGYLVKVDLSDLLGIDPFSGSVEIKDGQSELSFDEIKSNLYLTWIYDFNTEFLGVNDYDVVQYFRDMVYYVH